MNKIKFFFCEYCSWKKFLDSKDEEICKCLSCGRLLKSKQALDPQKKIEENKKLNKIKKEKEIWQKEIVEFKKNFKENDE